MVAIGHVYLFVKPCKGQEHGGYIRDYYVYIVAKVDTMSKE